MSNDVTVTWQSNYNGISVAFTDKHPPTEHERKLFDQAENDLPALTLSLVGKELYDEFFNSEDCEAEPPTLSKKETDQVIARTIEILGDQYPVTNFEEDCWST